MTYEYEYSIKNASILQRWVKNVTRAAVPLNTEMDIVHRKCAIGYRKAL